MNNFGDKVSFISVEPILCRVTGVPFYNRSRCTFGKPSGKPDNIAALVEKIQKSVDLPHEYRATLISAAATGKVDVREKAN